jgi:ubiquinone/menaquinone biosynthesis C-methylase UbiE
MPLQDAAQVKAAATYNAAADAYDDPANSFWDPFGQRTVDRLGLAPTTRVLDVCCGSGGSAIPAAERVGSNGDVLGVDLAGNLIERARAKAARRNLTNVQFRIGHMLDLDLPDSSFDVVICVFGIFFVPDMSAAVRALACLVRPGGAIAITTWGPRFFEPVNGVFWSAIQTLRPDLQRPFRPWERVSEPQLLRDLFSGTDVARIDVVAEPGTHSLRSPEDWWPMVLGTGYRGTIEQLSEHDRILVKHECLEFIRESAVTAVEANVVYAIATRTS